MTVGADDACENTWTEFAETGYRGSEDGQNGCFCRKLREHSFVRNLERSAMLHFDWSTFWRELLYHTFFPLTLPLIVLWEGGSNGIINRQFWGSRLAVPQWIISIAFFALNGLTAFYLSPDIIITDILWIMRNMILATKYGFINKGEMNEMREQVLPYEVHSDRTLVLAWTNPIPLRVLKRELLLAAVRKDQIRCTAAVRLVPGAPRKLVQDIMQQLSSKKSMEVGSHSPSTGSGWGKHHDRTFGFDQTFHTCSQCSGSGGENDSFEDRWIDLCINKVCREPGLLVPKDKIFTEAGESAHSSQRSELGDEVQQKTCPALDLPALLVAAYIIQRSCDLLTKKNFLHQIYSSPWRVYWCSALVACIHCAIPFAARAVIGVPSTFGGHRWFHIIVSLSSIAINYSAMSASIMFMIAGSADFRRRYFISRLLNTLLKDGWYGEEKMGHKKRDRRRKLRHLERKSVYHLGLTLDFSDPRSLAGWWSIRAKVQDFGFVFYLRVKQYASYFAMYCALLMAFLIVELFANGARTTIYVLAIVVFDLLVFVILLCMMVFPGGATNDMNHEHGATLVRKKLVVSNQLHCTSELAHPEDRSTLVFALDLMHSISAAVYWDNLTLKVTILGFTAGGEFVAVLIGFGSAAIGIAVQQFTNRIH